MASTVRNSMDVTDFVVKKGNGVKGLVDSGIEKLPERYILPPHERLDMTRVVSEESIPIIDVSNWNDPDVVKSICEAASKWGFFQIVNHGIPLQVMENIKNAAHGFFQLPNEERRKYYKGLSPSDTVFFATSFSPQAEVALEWKDYLSFCYVPGNDQDSELWPSICKDQVLEYMKRAEMVIEKLLQVLLKGIGVMDFDEVNRNALMGSPRINLNFYPKCPNPELTAGVGPHSEISTITVLLQDYIGGLYVRGGIEDDTWIHVPPNEGALVINVGDVLQIMSYDRYKSVEHRVVVNRYKNRVSVPIFVNPGADAVFGPLAELVENGEKPIYQQLVFSDYFNYFFSKPHDGKKTIDYAKIKEKHHSNKFSDICEFGVCWFVSYY